MSTPSPQHGAEGCRCEECLTDRIRVTAALAAGRDMSGLRARLDGTRDSMAAPARLRSVS